MRKIKKYICLDCGTEVDSPQNAIPMVTGWDNGHFCEFTLIGEYDDMSDKEFVTIDGETYYLLGTIHYN